MVSEQKHQDQCPSSPLSTLACLIVIGISCIVFAGWQFDIAAMKSVLPGLTAMNPGGTALAFLLTSLSVLAYAHSHNKALHIFSKALAISALLIAVVYFINQALGLDSGPDQMFFRQKLDQEALTLGHANRMAPNTAAALLLLSVSLLLIDYEYRRLWPTQFLALTGILVGILTIIGYAYNTVSLIGVKAFIPMALNTAICFILLNTAILLANPHRGLVAIFRKTTSGGVTIRRLLPIVVITPPVAGWLFRWGHQAGLIGEIAAYAFFVLTIMVVLAALVWWIAVSLDKFDQKQQMAALELKNAKETAERANAAKSEFLANMSHELRTPMNSILGMTRLLYEENDISTEHRDMVGIVYRSADNLLDILNDLLDLSKIDAKELKLESISFSLKEVISNVVDTMALLSSEKGISLSCSYKTENIPYLIGDPVRLGRIVMNLVGNAVKFTDQGGVKIDVDCQRSGEDHVMIEIRVADTGIGIPQDKQAVIFKKFSQADESITRRFGGTGLGLNITKHLVEMMMGTIGVESSVGKGSEFSICIPFKTADSRPVILKQSFRRNEKDFLPINERKPIQNAKILLAEDHISNQMLMKKLFKRNGINQFDIVDNGLQAMEMYNQNNYDLILTDCHMPEMSGFDLTAKIRMNDSETKRAVRIVAMTADAMSETRKKCFESGMDDFITKPVNSDELELVLSRWFILPTRQKDNVIGKTDADIIDLASLRAYMDNDEELKNYIEIFIQQSDAIIETMKNSHSKDDETWIGAAHKLQGGASMIGANRLKELCERAQNTSAVPADERKSFCKEIIRHYDEVKTRLRQAI